MMNSRFREFLIKHGLLLIYGCFVVISLLNIPLYFISSDKKYIISLCQLGFLIIEGLMAIMTSRAIKDNAKDTILKIIRDNNE